MKCEVIPSEVSKIVPLASSSYSPFLSELVENTYGFVSKNGSWLFLVQDTVINVYHAESGRWNGGLCFAKSLNNPSAKISAAVEFSSSHIAFPCLLLAVNQDNESLLCMFNVTTCRVQRSVLIPDKITSLDVVSENGGACIETHYLNRKLRYMFGVVAVGTLHGHLFLLDLCLDEDFNCDETLPNITTVVRKREFTPEKRVAAISKKQHILLHLNDESTCGSSFEFKNLSSTLRRYPNGDVYVTALKYLPRLASLAVGFSFGGTQLWELHNLSLQHSISDHDKAIVKFGFQEPENDPRNFCYLWVVKGHLVGEDTLPTSTSVCTLYSLTYHSRDHIENFGTLYTDLLHCGRKFDLPLTKDIYNSVEQNSSFGSRLISCQVVNQKDILQGVQPSNVNESDAFGDDISLCFISWEVWMDSENASYHLVIFDLNQWYQAHMPLSFRGSAFELNPYLGIFSVEEIGHNFLEQGVLGFHTISQTLKKFRTVSESEEFFYPSSLEFKLLCFTENGIRKVTYFGYQKQLLCSMAELGPQVVMNPKDLFPLLVKSGLVSISSYNMIEQTPLTFQKEAILRLALEHNLPHFFLKCLKEWKYSDSMHEYCTSKDLLAWAWKKVIFIKNSVDKICVPLFNGSGDDLDKPPLNLLYSFRKQLNIIERIMSGYQKFVTPRTEQGTQELQCRKDAVSCINLYLQVVLWLRSSRILPENIYVKGTTKSITYNYEELHASYKMRRSQLEKLGRLIDPSDVLLIDGIVKELGMTSSWLEKNGTEMYPPPSIYAAVSCYLLDEVCIEMKHSFMLYFLLDLENSNKTASLSQELKKFLVVFGMPKHLAKIVKAFWYLDQKNTVLSIEKLFHPSVKTTDILPWQHNRIIKSFLSWKAPKQALKYINHMEPPQTTLDAMKLHLSILLACGAVTEGWEYQRRKVKEGFGLELMNHFFLGCQEMHLMKDLMYLPLNSLESSSLIKFLSENQDPKAQEYLVIYHLLHCNFFEAVNVNEKLSKLLMQRCLQWNGTPVEKRTADRGFLVENLMGAVSEIEKCLMEEMRDIPHDFIKKEILQPISVAIKSQSTSKNIVTVSKIVKSLIFKDSPCVGKKSYTSGLRSRILGIEDLPFLRPPVIPQSVCSKQIETPRSVNSLAKRALESLSPTEYSSPAKRSRLLDNVSFMSPSLRKTPKSLAGDIASLLQTPPIPMHTPTHPVSENVTPALKPQSILKNKMKEHVKLNFYTCSTPSASEVESSEGETAPDEPATKECVFSKAKKDSEDSESLSKQLRFDLPEGEQSVTDVSLCPESPNRTSFSIEVALKVDDELPEEDSSQSSCLTVPQVEECLSYAKDTTSSVDSESMEVEPPAATSKSVSDDDNVFHSFLERPEDNQDKESGTFDGSNTVDFLSKLGDSSETGQSFILKSSCVTPRLPIRSNFEVDGSSEDQVKGTSSSTSTSAFNASFLSANEIKVSQNESVSEQSELFFSPCAEEEKRTSFIFSAPVSLFPESSASLESQEAMGESLDVSNYIPAASVTMDTSSEETDVEAPSETPEVEVTTPHQRKYVFSKPLETRSTSRDETKSHKKEYTFTKLTSFSDSTNLPSDPKSNPIKELETDPEFPLFPERSASFKSQEAMGEPLEVSNYIPAASVTMDTSSEETDVEAPSETPKVKVTKPRQRKYVFSKPLETKSTSRDKTKPRKKKYIFTKLPSSSDSTNLQSDPKPESDTSKSTVSEKTSSCQTLIEKAIESDEAFSNTASLSRPSTASKGTKKKFVFSKLATDQSSSVKKSGRTPRQPKTYVFSKISPSPPVDEEVKEDEVGQESSSNKPTFVDIQTKSKEEDESKLFEKEAGTYEEFSKSLSKSSSNVGDEETDSKVLISSPSGSQSSNVLLEKNVKPKTASRKKKEKSTILTTEIEEPTPKSSKKKNKSKAVPKMEFSFSEPHSPADSEILLALAKSPTPVDIASFVFSPPLTRGRLRKKQMDDTLGSSFCSVASDMSFARPKTPPLMESSLSEGKSSTKKKLSRISSQSKSSIKKSSTKKTRATLEKSVLLSPVREVRSTPTKKNSPSKDTSLRHSMVLRQNKPK